MTCQCNSLWRPLTIDPLCFVILSGSDPLNCMKNLSFRLLIRRFEALKGCFWIKYG